MEVHAHTHTPRKKWTHYFWEFFMLFLAVTLGFFVENQREHYIEGQREKKYIQNLVHDLAREMPRMNTIFYSTDATMNQLKNSGALRLIKKTEVADSIVAYNAAMEAY